MDINFELYKVFYHVSRNLSFSAASEQLYISQSAVSQAVKTLEEKLNCQLFYRNTKKVALTREGEMLFRHIEQAYNFIKSGERTILEMHSLDKGEVKIGATDTICKYYIMPYLKQFNKAYPNVKIHVTNRTSPVCMDLLRNGTVDFSVINIPEKFDTKHFNIASTRKVKFVFAASYDFASLKDRPVSLKELENFPVLLMEKNTTTRGYFDSLLETYAVDIKPEVELGSVEVLTDMVKIGLGIAFVPYEAIYDKLTSNQLFILDIIEEIPERTLGIITNASIPISIAALKFIEMMNN